MVNWFGRAWAFSVQSVESVSLSLFLCVSLFKNVYRFIHKAAWPPMGLLLLRENQHFKYAKYRAQPNETKQRQCLIELFKKEYAWSFACDCLKWRWIFGFGIFGFQRKCSRSYTPRTIVVIFETNRARGFGWKMKIHMATDTPLPLFDMAFVWKVVSKLLQFMNEFYKLIGYLGACVCVYGNSDKQSVTWMAYLATSCQANEFSTEHFERSFLFHLPSFHEWISKLNSNTFLFGDYNPWIAIGIVLMNDMEVSFIMWFFYA